MRGGIVLLVIGLFLGWLAVSGKYCCLGQLWQCASSDSAKPCECGGGQTAQAAGTAGLSLGDVFKSLDDPGVSIFPYSGPNTVFK